MAWDLLPMLQRQMAACEVDDLFVKLAKLLLDLRMACAVKVVERGSFLQSFFNQSLVPIALKRQRQIRCRSRPVFDAAQDFLQAFLLKRFGLQIEGNQRTEFRQ